MKGRLGAVAGRVEKLARAMGDSVRSRCGVQHEQVHFVMPGESRSAWPGDNAAGQCVCGHAIRYTRLIVTEAPGSACRP